MDIFGNFKKLSSQNNKPRDIGEFSYNDVTLEGISRIEDKEQIKSQFYLKLLIAVLFFILIGKIFFLQVVSGESNKKLAEGNRIRPRLIPAQRGIIFDSNGEWLARNKPYFVLGVYPSDLPKNKKDREVVYQQIADIIGIESTEIKDKVEKRGLSSLDYVTLKEGISHDDSLIFTKKLYNIPGVSVINKSNREYSLIPGLSHILGYVGSVSQEDIDKNNYYPSDVIGKSGLESFYESELKGTHGIEQIEVDSKGNIVRVLVQDGRREPLSGQNITLYLNQDLQAKTAEALSKGLEEASKTLGAEVNAGVAAVMDVKSGGILSLVSLPSYDNNIFSGALSTEDYKKIADDPTYPMFNRATRGTYPPGSIIKIVMAAAGLNEKVINVNTAFDTPSEIRIGDYSFPDWKDHGITNIERAIAESNNIFFYAIGGGFDKIKGIGINKINQYWKLFGLGEHTGIDLPSEAVGLLPDEEWKQKSKGEPWYLGDTYHVSIGQGDLLVTPLQMLRITATFANGGKLLHPQLVKKVSTEEGKVVEEFGPRIERENFINPQIIKTVQEGMRMTITQGSAQNLSDLPVSVAGKTGTAQFLNNQKTHAWFEAYAPYEDPEIAIIVMVEGGGGGHEIAAPIAKEILSYYFSN